MLYNTTTVYAESSLEMLEIEGTGRREVVMQVRLRKERKLL